MRPERSALDRSAILTQERVVTYSFLNDKDTHRDNIIVKPR